MKLYLLAADILSNVLVIPYILKSCYQTQLFLKDLRYATIHRFLICRLVILTINKRWFLRHLSN